MTSRTVCIIQARCGSRRLPGKVLAPLAGRSMLEHVVERARRIPGVDATLVATTTSRRDDALASLCRRLGIDCVRGPEDDVLRRFGQAARQARATAIVRITADCPFLDPEVAGRVVAAFTRAGADYASNTLERTWPRGLDTEVVIREALEAADREASRTWDREHVTPWIQAHPDRFRLVSVRDAADHAAMRWTVDTPEDLAFARAVYARLPSGSAAWRDVLRILDAHPEIATLNDGVRQVEPPGA